MITATRNYGNFLRRCAGIAAVGDWRYDLVTLAFWSAIVPEQIAPEVAQIVVDRMRDRCPPDVLAFFAALRTLLQLDFDTRVHPDHLGLIIPRIEHGIAPWWRRSLIVRTASMCGFDRHCGAICSKTSTVSRARGKARRSARTTGVAERLSSMSPSAVIRMRLRVTVVPRW